MYNIRHTAASVTSSYTQPNDCSMLRYRPAWPAPQTTHHTQGCVLCHSHAHGRGIAPRRERIGAQSERAGGESARSLASASVTPSRLVTRTRHALSSRLTSCAKKMLSRPLSLPRPERRLVHFVARSTRSILPDPCAAVAHRSAHLHLRGAGRHLPHATLTWQLAVATCRRHAAPRGQLSLRQPHAICSLFQRHTACSLRHGHIVQTLRVGWAKSHAGAPPRRSPPTLHRHGEQPSVRREAAIG